MTKRIFLTVYIAAGLLLLGCNTPKEQLSVFNQRFESTDFNSACSFAEKNIKGGKNPARNDLLWTLQAATAKRILKDYSQSTKSFDTAESFFQFYDLRSSAADGISATAVNDNIIPYKGQQYDGVMLNTYKALNFLSEGKFDLAKVEFNRALDRQRRTKEKFEKEINAQKEKLEKETNANLIKSAISDPNTAKTLRDTYPQLYEYQAYKNYTNPFVTYLASVYFNSIGQPSAARDLLKETYGLVPQNNFVAREFEETEKLIAENNSVKNNIWLIFENGLCPVKEEFRIDLPLFIATDRVYYAGVALPRLSGRDIAFAFLQVESDGTNYRTQLVCDMDKVIQSEFQKDFQAILARAIISTTARITAQYALTSQDDSTAAVLSSIMVALYSFATNAADVRIWSSLPKNFQIASFPIPPSGTIKITPQNSEMFNVNIPPCNNVIVYVKIINRNSKPIYDVIPL